MDVSLSLMKIEEALEHQLRLLPDDEAAVNAGRALLAAVGPAFRMAALDLAEQAALEIGAQLPGQDVQVVMAAGEPQLRVIPSEHAPLTVDEDYEARISLRLPPSLKQLIEESAGTSGESVNGWLVKNLSTRVTSSGIGTRMKGRIDT